MTTHVLTNLIGAISQAAFVPLYYVFAVTAYLCIAAVCVMAIFFGRRARRNVKRERVKKLPDGFSPLDVQRIFIGKTYPTRQTRALLAHWAKMGYIKIIPDGKFRVRVQRAGQFPMHYTKTAKFYDRGTYVRERALFAFMMNKYRDKPVNLFRSMFSRAEIKESREMYATREDEGVYNEKHYRLKVITTWLSLAPYIIMSSWQAISNSNPMYIMMVLMGALGFFVLRFMTEMPLPFRIVWCSMWLGVPLAFLLFLDNSFDPLYASYAACAMVLIGPFVLIRFCDYRVKNNLAEYSDLINYRKFLLFAKKSELKEVDYYAALPFIYAYHISFFVKRKFGKREVPTWLKKNGDGTVDRSYLL